MPFANPRDQAFDITAVEAMGVGGVRMETRADAVVVQSIDGTAPAMEDVLDLQAVGDALGRLGIEGHGCLLG